MKLIKSIIKDLVGIICLSSLFAIASDCSTIWMQILWYIGCLATCAGSGILFAKLDSLKW